MPKYVRDSVHGEIQIPDEFLPIVDNPFFQRLRGIQQLGLTNLIYPGATHTRFLHCLGAFHIAKSFNDEQIMLYALIHDAAHPPLSHIIESALKDANIDFDHESQLNKHLRNLLSKTSFSLRDLKKAMKKGTLVHGDLGVDRMDYLVRDSYFTGVTAGHLHWKRLVRLMRVEEGKTIIHPKAIESVEQFFIARFIMGSAVYRHKTNLILEEMISKALKRLLKKSNYEDLIEMDDAGLIAAFRDNKESNTIWSRVESRNLFKLFKKYDSHDDALRDYEKLVSKIGDDFVVVGRRKKWYKSINVFLETGENLLEVSPLVNSLIEADKKKEYSFIAVDKSKLAKAKRLC